MNDGAGEPKLQSDGRGGARSSQMKRESAALLCPSPAYCDRSLHEAKTKTRVLTQKTSRGLQIRRRQLSE